MPVGLVLRLHIFGVILPVQENANYEFENSTGHTMDITSFLPNPWGFLMFMEIAGNSVLRCTG